MNLKTNLHRQVNPSWIDRGQPSTQVFTTSQAFKPAGKDDGKLSVYNGEKFTGEQSFHHFVGTGFSSAGVVSVLCEECDTLELPYVEDNTPFDGHAYIDYSSCSRKEMESRAKRLKEYAKNRGWSYRP